MIAVIVYASSNWALSLHEFRTSELFLYVDASFRTDHPAEIQFGLKLAILCPVGTIETTGVTTEPVTLRLV